MLESELKGAYIHPEKEGRVYILCIFWRFTGNFSRAEMAEHEVTFHDRIELIHLYTILEY